VCLKTISITLIIKAGNATLDITVTAADIVILIREVIQRGCEKNENKLLCAAIAETIEDLDAILRAAVVIRNIDGSVTVTVPDMVTPQIGALIRLIIADPYSTGPDYSFQAVNPPTQSTQATMSSASTVVLSALALFALAFVM